MDAHWHVLDKGDGDKRIYADGLSLTLDGRARYTGSHAYAQSVSNTLVLNTWQHVAMTWSAADNITRLYHNGVEVSYAKKEVGTGSILDDTTHPFLIGTRGNLSPETFFNGLIDEVRLYGQALSAQEVWGLYNYVSSYRVGDLNWDFKVDFQDVLILTSQWLWVGSPGSIQQDIIADGVVNLPDFGGLAENWRKRDKPVGPPPR